MKRILSRLRRAVAVLLMLTLLCGTLAQAASAEYGRVFVSEVQISISKDKQEAIAYLKREGYTVVEQNLNEGTGNGALYVFLGYKTTRNPEKALTDITVLNMNGNYVYTDVYALNRLCGQQLSEAVRAVQTASAALATAYQAGKKPAVWAYKALNNFLDTESDSLLGEILISEPGDETVERILSDAELTTVSLLFAILYVGNGTEDGKALATSVDGFSARAKRNADGETLLLAGQLLNGWGSISEPLKSYRNAPVKWDADDAAYKDYVARLNARELRNYLLGGALSRLAGGVKATDGQTLADFICREDLSAGQLCFLVEAMSEGQRAVAPYLTPDVLLFAGCDPTAENPENPDQPGETGDTGESGESGDSESSESTTGDNTEETTEPDSAEETGGTTGEEAPPKKPEGYDDAIPLEKGLSDRLEFFSFLGLTDEAVRHIRENADLRWFWSEWGEPTARTETLTELASSVYGDLFTNTFRVAYGIEIPSDGEDGDALSGLWRERVTASYMKQCFSELTGIRMTEVPYLWEMNAKNAVALHALYSGGMDVGMENLPLYKRIPAGMVQIRADENFTVYNGVSQRILSGSLTVVDGKAVALADVAGPRADLNGWSGTQWNALYVTDDPKAGKPILAENFCALADREQSGLERSFAHAFGETVPYNLNRYAREDRLGGLYLYFDRLTEYGEQTPTIFTGRDVCLAIAGGSAGGIIIGAVAVYVGYESRKRKQQEQQEQQEKEKG